MVQGVVVLVVAALLEAGGDALIRRGLQRPSALLLAGAVSLVAYGVLVNQGSLDFGRLMGVYIAVFFVVSQLIAILLFHQLPAARTLIGGTLIVSGGVLILT